MTDETKKYDKTDPDPIAKAVEKAQRPYRKSADADGSKENEKIDPKILKKRAEEIYGPFDSTAQVSSLVSSLLRWRIFPANENGEQEQIERVKAAALLKIAPVTKEEIRKEAGLKHEQEKDFDEIFKHLVDEGYIAEETEEGAPIKYRPTEKGEKLAAELELGKVDGE